jgi:hypothetical protein
VKFIPNDPQAIAYTAGMTDGNIYAIDPIAGTANRVFNTQDIVPPSSGLTQGGMPQLMTIDPTGTRL